MAENSPEKHFSSQNWQQLQLLLGFELSSEDKTILIKAFIHPSFDSRPGHNFEQLEFLGDALISFITADFLFKRFPGKKEGELSRLRSWLVSRTRLNDIGKQLQLHQWVIHTLERSKYEEARNTSGNVIEALVGAIFLCKGQEIARQFILQHMLSGDLDSNIFKQMDPKSYLQEWTQRQKKKLLYKHLHEAIANARSYEVECYIDGRHIATAEGLNKKAAELAVAQKAITLLGI